MRTIDMWDGINHDDGDDGDVMTLMTMAVCTR